jgi:purine nucleosidase/pyrimidine-specific ribonucleoside hydrolase
MVSSTTSRGRRHVPTKILLDTDIGDDIDDAIALSLIIASPELELVGVTTVFGNTRPRARQVQTFLAAAGTRFAGIPVFAGAVGWTSARRDPRQHVANHVADVRPDYDRAALPEAELPPLSAKRGVDAIIDTLMAGDGDIVPVCIGPLTNLAMALAIEPKLYRRIPRLILMGGSLDADQGEHNLGCDPEATHLVLTAGFPIEILPCHVGGQAIWSDAELGRLEAMGNPLARHLAHTTRVFRKGGSRKPVPFDALAVCFLLMPELFTWRTGTVGVEVIDPSRYGRAGFTAGPGTGSPHRVAWSVDAARANAAILDRIEAFRP